ncbi:replication initiation protein [Microlunatus elymi]|uniref:Replication initiation protein n=1 Tax=Microlunatus elymi TaxID=2596828 RepID=A0A516PXZ0_9ACTN|nr:replication initiator [Microlunatus elymi]QDP95831.1 replication initiation protein [Microlunatus elymi]
MSMRLLVDLTTDMVRELAVAEKVCVRPLLRRVLDRETGIEETVPIPCGSTLESVCPSCAHKARVLRMQQCAEGWHLGTEPEDHESEDDQEIGDHGQADEDDHGEEDRDGDSDRRVRSTRRRSDAADLPRVAAEDRTIGRTFTSLDGHEYRPSMFLTLTLPSYGAICAGAPVDPESYDYRRAAMDALLFPRLVDRFWQNLRRCAGYKVQYFAAVEPQHRLAPHLHAAIRGAIPRQLLRQVIRATYVQVWWPRFDRPVFVQRVPMWDGTGYADPDTGEVLPTWEEAVDGLANDPDARPAHVMRFGTQADIRGIIAPSEEADRAIRYLTKYLTKAIAEPLTTDPDEDDPVDERRDAHIDRLHAELRWLPCSEHCANWLRYGIQPKNPTPGMQAGHCPSKAHDREHLGVGGRRVLVSRHWSGKTLAEHKADRATVVREALHAAGIVPPEVERLAADVTAQDGLPRFVWTDTRPSNAGEYRKIIFAAIEERRAWREQYDAAKIIVAPVGDHSAIDHHSESDGPAP